MTARFVPFWPDRVPASRRSSFPRQRAEIDTDVVIIGGGLAGCACALACASARLPVVLLEAGRVAVEPDGGASGIVSEDFNAGFAATATTYGVRVARTLWQGLHRAALDLPAALRRLGVRCDLSPQDLLRIAPQDRLAARELRRDYEARRAAGFDHRWLTPSVVTRQTALASGGGLRTRASALDPYRACLGLAHAAVERGALLFEGTPVQRIRTTRGGIEVATAGGTVRGARVVVTTDASAPHLKPLRRHLRPRRGYAVVTAPLPAAVRRQLGGRTLALRDMGAPPHVVRWLKDDRVLIEGGDGDPVPQRSAEAAVVQRTGQLMYELSLLYPPISGTPPEWGWSFRFDDTADGLPCVGPHRSFPRHLFAFGMARHGAAAAWLAARVLFRQLNGEVAKGDEALGFARIL